MLIVATISILGFLRVSSGALLTWWADTLLRAFGWGAYPIAAGLVLAGVWLLWPALGQYVRITPAVVVGIEVLLVTLLTATHAPLVTRDGADAAFLAADAGKGGGYIGWALALILVEELGVLVAGVVMVGLFVLALYLLVSPAWGVMYDWAHDQARRIVALANRWWTRRQGQPVPPPVAEPRWWEQEPGPGEAKKKARPKPRPKKSRAVPADGSLPTLDLLDASSPAAYGDQDIRRKVRTIEDTLASFGVPVKVVEVNQGPTVTQFGLEPGYVEKRSSGGDVRQQRVRVARIASLVNDLALALAAAPLRIETPVPGRPVVGLEVPNEQIALVSLRGVLESPDFRAIDSRLAIALGEGVSGQAAAVDLALMPHLLIAGATGSGKSVCINAVICSLLMNNMPADLNLLLIDPKMVELVGYNDVPHLVAPVVVDVEQVVGALAWVTRQMDVRYKVFHAAGVRNLEQYNQQLNKRKGEQPLPTLVVIIDELADLMMVAPDEVERHICRLAQMGRATGIHLVIATQRPSVDVVTGLIKANFPARISFAVTSQVDSRVILDQPGAENLLGRGDMLFMSPRQPAPVRLQGCFVSDSEIERLTSFWRDRHVEGEQPELFPPWAGLEDKEEADDLLQEAITLVVGHETISTSFVQRRLRIGYPRAARIVDQLEERGIVGPDRGGGQGREVLSDRGIDHQEIEERLPGEEPRGS
ncbi:MAG: DNA translocase FtsK [Anaerolineae bacterium]|nr:DNA translocase FtsK [Anaerolineae bacterium]